MKKQALKAVTMLVSIIVLAFMTAVASNAQSSSHSLRVNVPFDFVVGSKTLTAGKYLVGTITSSSNEGIRVQSRDGRQSIMRLTNTIQASAPKDRAMLTFHRYGSTYFLSQIWMPGSAEGRGLSKSKAECAVERELAKNPSSGELANNAQPETVTIYAELQ